MIDFNEEDEYLRWAVVDDVVMGGVSRSRFSRTDRGTCVFSGEVSLEQGGGFASVRSVTSSIDLRGAKALTLVYRGDGKTYKLRLRATDELGGLAYQASFSTEPGVLMEHTFALEDFLPTQRGRSVPNAPPLDLEGVHGIGLLISDRQEGLFSLELVSLSKR